MTIERAKIGVNGASDHTTGRGCVRAPLRGAIGEPGRHPLDLARHLPRARTDADEVVDVGDDGDGGRDARVDERPGKVEGLREQRVPGAAGEIRRREPIEVSPRSEG